MLKHLSHVRGGRIYASAGSRPLRVRAWPFVPGSAQQTSALLFAGGQGCIAQAKRPHNALVQKLCIGFVRGRCERIAEKVKANIRIYGGCARAIDEFLPREPGPAKLLIWEGEVRRLGRIRA